MAQCRDCGYSSKDEEFCDRCGRGLRETTPPRTDDQVAMPDGARRVADLFSNARIEWPEVLSVVEAVGRALAPLHAEGRVHARLDPREIVFDETGGVRIFRCETAQQAGAAPGARVTVRGFSAPEVFGRGTGRLELATDVYSLGAILWRLLTGREPYADLDDLALEFPSPRLIRQALPFELDPLVRRSLAPMVTERPATVDDFLALLRRVRGRIYAREHLVAEVRVRFGTAIDIGVEKGRRYPVNQDALFCEGNDSSGRCAVIDGITHAGVGKGEEAAEITRGALARRDDEGLDGPIQRASEAIVAAAHAISPDFAGDPSEIMGAAVVAARWADGVLSLAWVGDARAYLLRDGELYALTIDHDSATDALRRGESPAAVREIPGGGQLSRSVGRAVRDAAGALVAAPVDAETATHRLMPGDRVLVTSDGIPDWIAATERAARAALGELLGAHGDPSSVAKSLVDAANQGGGGDNLSCVVLFSDAAPTS